MHHYRKTVATYTNLNANDAKHTSCHFCRIAGNEPLIAENKTMMVVKNRVSYDIFEDRKVIDHLLVIPKNHHDSINTFSNDERLDAMKIMGEYEALGYSVYARGMGSATRSVKHQHTHLIKLVEKPSRLIIYARKPYVLFDI
jgi:diadenosine tetraphosphate (Ap4A) HIT family hydrolase